MKLLTITVPCYNSQDYMERCIESLLPGGDEVEIIIVDDGSKDGTAEIADRYAEEYPNMVRVIHQPNGGHGDAVTTGMRNATGKYFKVVDSDDRVQLEAYRTILRFLRKVVDTGHPLDMLISNFVYDKQGVPDQRKKVIDYKRNLPLHKFFSWEDTKRFQAGHYLLMHAVIYKVELLNKVHLTLPKHTFYVDNIYVYEPLPQVKTMYYLPVNFYMYFTGRDDQSVNQKVMTQRVDQQLRINNIMFDSYDLEQIQNKRLKQYMYDYMQIMCIVTTSYLVLNRNEEKWKTKQEFWDQMKEKNEPMYNHLRWKNILGLLVNIPGRHFGGTIICVGYKIVQKIFGFN